MFLFWLINATAVLAVYLVWIRPILKKTPGFTTFYASERSYLRALSGKFAGIKQRLTAAAVYLAGVIVIVHDHLAPYMTGIDVTPMLPKIVHAIPAQYWPLVPVLLAGLMDYFRYLADRRSSGQPTDGVSS